jgi:hypothetical protein
LITRAPLQRHLHHCGLMVACLLAVQLQVWDIADSAKQNYLTRAEFYCAMRLIAMAQAAPGVPLSSEKLVSFHTCNVVSMHIICTTCNVCDACDILYRSIHASSRLRQQMVFCRCYESWHLPCSKHYAPQFAVMQSGAVSMLLISCTDSIFTCNIL